MRWVTWETCAIYRIDGAKRPRIKGEARKEVEGRGRSPSKNATAGVTQPAVSPGWKLTEVGWGLTPGAVVDPLWKNTPQWGRVSDLGNSQLNIYQFNTHNAHGGIFLPADVK